MAMVSSFLDLAPRYAVKNYIAQQAATACTELNPNRTAAFGLSLLANSISNDFHVQRQENRICTEDQGGRDKHRSEKNKSKISFFTAFLCFTSGIPLSFPLISMNMFTQRDE